MTYGAIALHVGDAIQAPVRSIEEALKQPVDSRLAAYAQTLSGLLSDGNGTLVSLDAIQDVANLAVWCRVLHDAGVSINWDESGILTFSMWRDENIMSHPLLVGSKKADTLVKPDELYQWWARSHPDAELEILTDATAEAVFRSLNSPQFVKGFRRNVGGLFQHMEIWRLGSLAFTYSYRPTIVGDLGTRELVFDPAYSVEQMIRSAKRRSDDRRSEGVDPRDVVEYDSPEAFDGGRTGPTSHNVPQTDVKHTPPDLAAEADYGQIGWIMQIGADAAGNPATYGQVHAQLE